MRKAFVIINQVAVAIASLTYLITCLANLPVVGQDGAQITRTVGFNQTDQGSRY
jgi:hypothetical protein